MTTIYQDYEDEPEDIFLPLPEELASEFYAIEMDSFTADIAFYEPLIPKYGSILEMGCGTGRIAGQLSNANRFAVGIDISLSMLQIAAKKCHPHCSYLCMDMINPCFAMKFDTIIIPYNTLNLLATMEQIIGCLQGCKKYLHTGGKLLVQLFVPTDNFTCNRKKTFQFQIFDRPQGGKIIKEIIKQYVSQSQSVLVEERFRVRPMQEGKPNDDYHSVYSIAGFSAEKWLFLFKQAGFNPESLYGDYMSSPYDSTASSSLLAIFTFTTN